MGILILCDILHFQKKALEHKINMSVQGFFIFFTYIPGIRKQAVDNFYAFTYRKTSL